MAADLAAESPTETIPRSYHWWLGAALVSQLGDVVVLFAIAWTASAHGGQLAGLVSASMALPRTVLLLAGGVLADRLSARTVMLACDATMIIVAGALALTSAWSTPAWTLLAFGLVSGTVSAFYLPASGSMPRRLVGTTLLPRALALRLAGSQVVSLVGPPLAGLLVVAAGLGGTAALDALTFAVVLLVLVKVVDAPERPTPSRQNVLRDAADGIRLTLGDPRLRPALLLTGVVAGLVLPTGSLLVPLLARARDWSAPTVGLTLGAQAVGGILVSLLVSRRGAYARAGLAAAASVAPMALGMAFLATIPVGSVASVGGLLIGAGVGLFASHIGPIILGSSPESHLNRVQAVVALVQSVPLLVTVNVLGNLAAATSPATTLFVVAATLAATGLAAGSRLSHL